MQCLCLGSSNHECISHPAVCAQAQNKERAFAILRAKLFEIELQKQQAEIYAKRKSQVGVICVLQVSGWYFSHCASAP